VTDTAGRRWFLKFDPPGYRGMATGTEVAVTKLMWALGYNVAENHIAYLRPEQLAIGATAKFTPKSGRKRPMRPGDLETLLAGVEREADGTYRVVASKALDGTPIGRIRFFGTRPDDPNDIVPHEDRRELRGYGVLDHNERPPQASQATVEGTLCEHSRKQMPEMFAHIPHDTALTFPWDAAAPLDRQPQAEHLGVAHLSRWPPTGGQAGFDVALVKIVHDDVQCDKEGFEIEFHGHVSFGERVNMAVDSRRNLPLLSSE
jgi:hypothetical protein